jgi:hypothetical protein
MGRSLNEIAFAKRPANREQREKPTTNLSPAFAIRVRLAIFKHRGLLNCVRPPDGHLGF